MSDDSIQKLNILRRAENLAPAFQMLEEYYKKDFFNPVIYLELGKTLFLTAKPDKCIANLLTGLHLEIQMDINEKKYPFPLSYESKAEILSQHATYLSHIGMCQLIEAISDPEIKSEWETNFNLEENYQAYLAHLQGLPHQFTNNFIPVLNKIAFKECLHLIQWSEFPLRNEDHFFATRDKYIESQGQNQSTTYEHSKYMHWELLQRVDRFISGSDYDNIDLFGGLAGQHFNASDLDGPNVMKATKTEKVIAALLAIHLIPRFGVEGCMRSGGTGFYRTQLEFFTDLKYLETMIVNGEKVRNCAVGKLTTILILSAFQNSEVNKESMLGLTLLLGEKYISDETHDFFYSKHAA